MGAEQSAILENRNKFKDYTRFWSDCCDSKLRWAENFDEDVIKSYRNHMKGESKKGISRVLPYSVHTRDGNEKEYLDRILLYARKNEASILADSLKNVDYESSSSLLPGSPEFALTGKAKYSCYVDRQLPGVVKRHRARHYPTNAEAWDETIGDWGGDPSPQQETARTVTIDDFTENDPLIYDMLDPKDHQPIITKAGSRLWSISFVGKIDDNCAKRLNALIIT